MRLTGNEARGNDGDVGALERIDAALGNVISADFSGRVGARGLRKSQ
jgi:hypothetical protein